MAQIKQTNIFQLNIFLVYVNLRIYLVFNELFIEASNLALISLALNRGYVMMELFYWKVLI